MDEIEGILKNVLLKAPTYYGPTAFRAPKPKKGRLPDRPSFSFSRDDPKLRAQLKLIPDQPRFRPSSHEPSFSGKLLPIVGRKERTQHEIDEFEKFERDLDGWKKETAAIEAENERIVQNAEKTARAAHEAKLRKWQADCEEIGQEHADDLAVWQKEKSRFDSNYQREIEGFKGLWKGVHNSNPAAIKTYLEFSLHNCTFEITRSAFHEVNFDPENQVVLIDFDIPDFDRIEIWEEGARGPKRVPKTRLDKAKKLAIHSLVLRAMHDLSLTLAGHPISAICLNGMVTFIDKTTGHERTETILSVFAEISTLGRLNITRVDPIEAFRALKGVIAPTLKSYEPVPPIMRLNKADRRIIEGKEVISGIDVGENIAAMHWDDFEHLIRELFEKEFAESGAEVNVTQASRDSGVDAIVFDPDPIRGGKYVIQAKRYTRTVDVSAVRDLFGTLQNEGANRGILVTTSKFGPDAYTFAKGKPITLIDGSNLLAMLKKHGHDFRINISEARKIIKEKGWL